MNNLNEFLKLYFDVNEKDLETVASLFHVESLRKNEFYLSQGKRCDKFSFIKDGALRIYSLVDGKEITQWIALSNSFVTELDSFTFGNPSRWNIQSLTDTTLYTISKENYSKLSLLINEWHTLEKKFIIHCFTAMENRIFRHLSQTAQERYESFFQKNKEIFNQLPLQYIASMLGMSAETLSRIRNNQNS